MKLENVRNRDLHWEGLNLCYQKGTWVRLVPDDKYPEMYHLEFKWRNFAKTPEMFNIINARENARVYTLQRMPREAAVGVTDAFK